LWRFVAANVAAVALGIAYRAWSVCEASTAYVKAPDLIEHIRSGGVEEAAAFKLLHELLGDG
jgi:hypothetical protein